MTRKNRKDLELELVPEDSPRPEGVPYPFLRTNEQKLRCFVFDVCSNREQVPDVCDMASIVRWIRDGASAQVERLPKPKAVT